MAVSVESEVDPRDRTRTAYRITGPSFIAVQGEIERLSTAPDVASADFQIPQRNRAAGGYSALGQTFAAVSR